MEKKKSVLLGMSGGVDSTAAAWLLLQQGYEVVGVTFRLQDQAAEDAGNAARDISDAKAVCEKLEIRHMVLDGRERFREQVVSPFVQEYDRGRTPNPCVVCNRMIKFPFLLETADREGIGFVATGHYAQMVLDPARGMHRLARAASLQKDQSYALFGLNRQWLPRILLPLGGCDKPQVRAIAADAGLGVAGKADSQDICFVPDGDYGAFLERHTGTPGLLGNFVDERGTVLGPHRGIRYYTVGQRKGLGITLGAPAFVKHIDAATGEITLSDNEGLFSDELLARAVNWLDRDALKEPAEVQVKIRYAHIPQPAVLYPLEDGCVRVRFRERQRAVTPGQAAVFYDENYVLGGGIIEAAPSK